MSETKVKKQEQDVPIFVQLDGELPTWPSPLPTEPVLDYKGGYYHFRKVIHRFLVPAINRLKCANCKRFHNFGYPKYEPAWVSRWRKLFKRIHNLKPDTMNEKTLEEIRIEAGYVENQMLREVSGTLCSDEPPEQEYPPFSSSESEEGSSDHNSSRV